MNTRAFKDHFSKQSDIYVKYRPQYPAELYSFLASLTNEHQLAWDCGTGNGQAAIGLAEFYDKVIATDPSEQQIKNAFPHKKVKYIIEKAENNSLKTNSVDLLTIANALHWFNFDAFYKEANRVLKPNGVIAVWAVFIPFISAEINEVLNHYHYKTLDNYWLPENRIVEKEYSTIPFPFHLIETPEFFIEKKMNFADVIGFLNTWSATQRFITENKYNPTDKLRDDMLPFWKNTEEEKTIRWKIILKVGRTTK